VLPQRASERITLGLRCRVCPVVLSCNCKQYMHGNLSKNLFMNCSSQVRPHWACYSAESSVSVAIAVALITRRQWLTNRATLKHQLFDRRYAIYERITAFLAEVMQSGNVSAGSDQQFLRDTKQAYFVFSCDDEVSALVSQIYKHAVALHALEAERPSTTGEEVHANVQTQRVIKDWFSETLKSMEGRFEKYLRLDD
jgi:hypothetical protein